MTKGRHPIKAIDAARTIAEKRGLVQYLERGPDRVCDFEIVSPPILSKVRIKRMGHIRCMPQSLEREAYGEITDLKMYPSSREISRELWICSKKYFFRFFRVTDAGLVELGPDGQPLPPGSPPRGYLHRRVLPPVTLSPVSTDLPGVLPTVPDPGPVRENSE
jgi:hypothetical protein